MTPATGTIPAGRAPSRGLIVVAVGLSVLLASLLFAMAMTEWREFRLPYDMGRDQALTNQSFYLEAHEHRWFPQTVDPISRHDGSYVWSLLAGHFSPIFYMFLPIYAVWQSPLMLMLIGSCAVATFGVAGMLVAWRIFGSGVVALIWFGLFALHPPIAWSVVANGFREMFVATGFLSLALLFYIEERYRLFLVMLILAVLCKEDVALLLPVWGVVAGLQGRGWRLAGLLILLGVVYFIGVNAIVLPLLREEPPGYIAFPTLHGPLGYTPGHMLHSIWSAPGDLVRVVGSRENLGYWAAIFSPLLFLPVLGWEYLVIPAYIYAEFALDPYLQYIPLRYGVPAIPFIFVAGMVGTLRLVRFVERMAHQSPVHARVVRTVTLGAVLCGMVGTTMYSTPFPALLRQNWPARTGLREDASLMQVLTHMPSGASLAASRTLIAESTNRDRLIVLGSPNFSAFTAEYTEQLRERGPDYLALALSDLDDARVVRQIESVLCQGTYGVVYADGARFGRLVMARGAGLSMNRVAAETLFPALHHEGCPAHGQEVMSPQVFTKAASIHARAHVPLEIWSDDMFPGPVAILSATRFAQVIYLPDHTFEPGWYRLDLMGAWPWWGTSASYRVAARVLVGERTVGQVAFGGDQPLRYTTLPFHVDTRVTLPIRVQVELRIPEGRAARVFWALRPTRGDCAIVADAPSLDPQQVTVEAWIYAEGLYEHPGTESEAPIVSKNNAPGYYLRLSGDDQGKVWVDFNVAGKWALGRAGTVPLHQWTAVAATYDGQEARIYINGQPAPQIPSRSPRYAGPIRSQGAPLAIGCRDPGEPYEVVFPGLIASARVWNRVLTPQEIRDGAIMRPVPMRNQGLVAGWRFQTVEGSAVPGPSAAEHSITSARQLTRVAASENTQPLSAWRSRELNILRLVTVQRVTP